MAPQMQTEDNSLPTAENRPSKRANRRRAKPANGRASTAKRTTRSRRSSAADITDLERMIRTLEGRIADLANGRTIHSAVSGATNQVGDAVTRASNQVGEVVANTLTEAASRLLSGATSVTGAARVGTGAMQKIGNELERRPFMTVAIALGIGFLAGLAGRREAA